MKYRKQDISLFLLMAGLNPGHLITEFKTKALNVDAYLLTRKKANFCRPKKFADSPIVQIPIVVDPQLFTSISCYLLSRQIFCEHD
jgi:hypothetical protein